MQNYEIEVHEVLSRVLNIEAESQNDAILKVKEMYLNEKVTLDVDDYVITKIDISKVESEISEDVLSNGNNFYEFDSEYVYFQGDDIKSKKIKIDEKIRDFLTLNDFNIDEVCEFNQSEDFELYRMLNAEVIKIEVNRISKVFIRDRYEW